MEIRDLGETERFPVIGLVGSAGGFDDVLRILRRLPTTLDAAVTQRDEAADRILHLDDIADALRELVEGRTVGLVSEPSR